MSRIACLRIPLFQIAAQRKYEPALKRKPLVLLLDNGGQSDRSLGSKKIIIASADAIKQDVVAGMRLSQARAICADLAWRYYDAKLYEEAQRAIANELIAYTPRVSAIEPGLFILDAQGLAHMGGESKFCHEVLKTISRLGYLEGHIGVADSAFAATMATRLKKRRWYVVPPGKDAPFMVQMPVKYLPLDIESVQILQDLGVTTIGKFAQLPASSVAERFGEAGRKAHDLALGLDKRQPVLPVVERQFQCSMEIGGPIEALNEALFILKSLLDRITTELKREGFDAEELTASFFNDRDLIDERLIKLIRPSNSAKFLLEVVRLSLETKQLPREFTGVRIVVSRFCKESWEQRKIGSLQSGDRENDLFSESSMLLLQRLTTRLGEDKVVCPQASDQYALSHSGFWLPVIDSHGRSVRSNISHGTTPVDVQYILDKLGHRGLLASLAIKLPKEPIPVLVEIQDKQPVSLAYGGHWYRITMITSAECLSGQWWESPMRKSYYVAAISLSARNGNIQQNSLLSPSHLHAHEVKDNLVVLLVHEHNRDAWSIEGVYD
ncbi:MAG TPA: DNA polymerase Y family protein [Candidatus Obscuribacterales bacterium]